MSAINKRQARRAFARFAKCDTPTTFAAERLWECVSDMAQTPAHIADIGGNGQFIAAQYPNARVTAIDFALPILRLNHSKKLLRVAADAEALPFPDAAFDMLWSNLCLEWTNHRLFFAEAARVLKPNGLLALTTLGPDTLMEMRDVFANERRVHDFTDMHLLADALLADGFAEPLAQSDLLKLTYSTADAALTEARNIGAGCAREDRPHGLTGKTRWQRARTDYAASFCDGNKRLTATVEIILITAWRREKKLETAIHFYR